MVVEETQFAAAAAAPMIGNIVVQVDNLRFGTESE